MPRGDRFWCKIRKSPSFDQAGRYRLGGGVCNLPRGPLFLSDASTT
jgi:hypothetical protein